MYYSTTQTRTVSETVAATVARVRAVLLQVHVDFINALSALLVESDRVESWLDDLSYMLVKNAIEHFEMRVECRGGLWRAWRYEVSDDGSLIETARGGGIDFWDAPAGSQVRLVIRRRDDLPEWVSAELDRRGWTHKVAALPGMPIRERAYSKDCWGLVRCRIELER